MSFLRNITAFKQLARVKVPAERAACLVSNHQYHGYANEPTHPIPNKQPKWMSAAEAVSVVKSGLFALWFALIVCF